MAISAQEVKKLRDITGAGMMDCKKALEETGGDIDAAVELLQKKGAAAAAKKAGRIAAEGLVQTWLSDDRKSAVIVEVNCETDFVSRNEQFHQFVDTITRTIGQSGINSMEELEGATVVGTDKTVGDYTTEQIATIGEKLGVRRFTRFETEQGVIGDYIHAGGQIGVLVNVSGTESDDLLEFARDVAMHVAAMNPPYLTAEEIPADVAAAQESIFSARAAESGKPENIIPKIVAGQVQKWRAENSLLNQPFVKDSDVTVGQLQARYAGAQVTAFARFEVGEGIEKQEKSLSEEVAEQLRGK